MAPALSEVRDSCLPSWGSCIAGGEGYCSAQSKYAIPPLPQPATQHCFIHRCHELLRSQQGCSFSPLTTRQWVSWAGCLVAK